MKLRGVLFLSLLLFSILVFGQTKYGLKAGINFSDQYKKINPPGYPIEKIETKPLTGFQVGVFLKHSLRHNLSLATELNFSAIGSKTKYARNDFIVNPDGTISGISTGYYNDKIQQIEIPVFLQYNLDKFYLGFGPTIAIKISAKIDYQNNYFKSNYYNTFDLGASSILGYSMHKKVEVNLKYNYGLINTDKRDYSVIKNRVTSFSVLYSLK